MSDRVAYSPDEWAEVSGEGRTKVYEAISLGKLKARKNGRRTIILHEDGVEYLRSLPAVEPKGEKAQ